MLKSSVVYAALAHALFASAACPFMDGGVSLQKREGSSGSLPGDDGFLDQFVVDDKDVYTTTDFGTPVNDRTSLKAGQRGPTLLEDFVYRTKLLRFDRERIPERVGQCQLLLFLPWQESFGLMYCALSPCSWRRCSWILRIVC